MRHVIHVTLCYALIQRPDNINIETNCGMTNKSWEPLTWQHWRKGHLSYNELFKDYKTRLTLFIHAMNKNNTYVWL